MHSSPHATEPSITRALGADHEWLCRLLDRMIDGLVELGSRPDPASFGAFAQRLKRHVHVDVEILFPELERHEARAADEPWPPPVRRREHEAILQQLERVAAMMSEPGASALTAPLEQLRGMLARVATLDREVVYPACDRVLAPGVRSAAVRALDRKVTGTTPPGSS